MLDVLFRWFALSASRLSLFSCDHCFSSLVSLFPFKHHLLSSQACDLCQSCCSAECQESFLRRSYHTALADRVGASHQQSSLAQSEDAGLRRTDASHVFCSWLFRCSTALVSPSMCLPCASLSSALPPIPSLVTLLFLSFVCSLFFFPLFLVCFRFDLHVSCAPLAA